MGNIIKDEEQQPRVDTVFRERCIRPFRKELMDGIDMKEGHVKESNKAMGVLSSKFEASAGIVGVTNPDITHHHVERKATEGIHGGDYFNTGPPPQCPAEKRIKCEN